ncbi:MAG: BrnT family toxin [Holophagales bacterium]|jgi:uncharacterized DUF497 family protein|nr:BrnT family toxin [Holophagales bacterium]
MREFEWNESKAELNWLQHKIRFTDARFVFDDPFQISEPFAENNEQRWRTVGSIKNYATLLVISTIQEQNDTEIIRLISARKLSKGERKKYGYG